MRAFLLLTLGLVTLAGCAVRVGGPFGRPYYRESRDYGRNWARPYHDRRHRDCDDRY